MKRSRIALALLTLLVATAGAQEKPAAGDVGKAEPMTAPAARAPESTGDYPSSSTFRQVLAREYTILPRSTVYFDVPADLSGSQSVGISLATFSDPRSSLANVRIGVAFAAPGDWYIISDVILGSSFYYYDHGAATVPVYGPFMRLILSNDGPTLVRITQLAVYSVAH